MTNSVFEQAKLFLPRYLTPSQQRDLFAELERFPDNRGIYLAPGTVDQPLLQGDGWRGLVVVDFHSLEKKVVSGLILSNSCDIDARNPRNLPASVLFAPIIPLKQVIRLLEARGRSAQRIDAIVGSIRRQTTSNIFYLPDGPYGYDESIIFLDDIHAHPLDDFRASSKTQLFQLSQYGFYILLLKLSIHFSRFNEGIYRSA